VVKLNITVLRRNRSDLLGDCVADEDTKKFSSGGLLHSIVW